MLDVKVGSVLLFLVPGLCAYSAIYGLFGRIFPNRNKAEKRSVPFAPPPPPPTSIKAVTFILLTSLVIHFATALFIYAILALTALCSCQSLASLSHFDPYSLLFATPLSAQTVSLLIGSSLAQGFLTYLGFDYWLLRRARKNRLPWFLYGWTASLANLLDDDNEAIIATVMTTYDIEQNLSFGAASNKRVLTSCYVGPVHDLGIDQNGNVHRVTFSECERFNLDPQSAFCDHEPLAKFGMFTIEGVHIRNVWFTVVNEKNSAVNDDAVTQTPLASL